MQQNQLVIEIFDSDFLGIINQQLPEAKLTLEDLENSLGKVKLELTELRTHQEKSETMIVSPPISCDITKPGSSQINTQNFDF